MAAQKEEHKWKVGDRVICPRVDEVPGTVIEVGYNGFTKVEYDDRVIGCTTADELAAAPETALAKAGGC